MKGKYLALSLFVLSICGCSETGAVSADGSLLKEFVLVMNGKYYYANIDSEAREGRVGMIEYGSYISDVEYVLADGAVIHPDPKSFLGEWPAEQTFEISSGDDYQKWKIVLPSYISQVPEVDGREVIFQDEFNVDGPINEECWSYVKPGQDAWKQDLSGRPENSYIRDGNLVLLTAKNSEGVYKGGSIWTNGKVLIGTGSRFSARIKFVNDQESVGFAFWLMPYWKDQVYDGWPHCGEIDIMEHAYNHDYIQQTIHSYYIDVYDPSNNYAGKPKYSGFNIGQYNIYEVDVLENSIVFYVNGVRTMEYENMHLQDEPLLMQWPFQTNYYVILGHHPQKSQNIDGETAMLVDWVRVTKL